MARGFRASRAVWSRARPAGDPPARPLRRRGPSHNMTTTLTELKGVLGDQGRVRACMRRHRAGRGAGHDPAGGRVDRRIGSPAAGPPPAAGSPTAPRAGDPAARHDDTVVPRAVSWLPPVSRSAAVPGRTRVLALRIYWSPKPPSYPDDATMRGLLKDTAKWFAHASRGRHHMSGKVTPWLKVGRGNALRLRPSQASPRGRLQTRHRDEGLQPLHDHRATVRHQLQARCPAG